MTAYENDKGTRWRIASLHYGYGIERKKRTEHLWNRILGYRETKQEIEDLLEDMAKQHKWHKVEES